MDEEFEAVVPLINKVQKIMEKQGIDNLSFIKYPDSDNVSAFFNFDSNPNKTFESWEAFLDAAMQFFVSSSSMKLRIAIIDDETQELIHLYTQEDSTNEFSEED